MCIDNLGESGNFQKKIQCSPSVNRLYVDSHTSGSGMYPSVMTGDQPSVADLKDNMLTSVGVLGDGQTSSDYGAITTPLWRAPASGGSYVTGQGDIMDCILADCSSVEDCSTRVNCVNRPQECHWVTMGRSADSAYPVYTEEDYHVPPSILMQCPSSVRLQPRHYIGGCQSQMNIHSWEYYLKFEENLYVLQYLLDGITNGFAIVDAGDKVSSYYCDNYSSVLTGDAYKFVDKLISSEISEGKYVEASSIPHCVHALGAIPKQDGSYRPITDCRRPEGVSINNHMNTTFKTFNYITLDQVAANVIPGCYMAIVDISAAYRSVSIRDDQWTYQGVMWLDGGGLLRPLWDARLSFGLRCAPYIFTEISNFISSTMEKLGYSCVANYLDDFLVFGTTFQDCQEAQMALISLLGELGFYVSWKKCASPATSIRYLGIIIDSMSMCLSLPEDKLEKLKHELEFFSTRTRASKKQIQRLCGIIAHCSKVIRGGRKFSRRIIDLLAGLTEDNPRIRLSEEFKLDLNWWIEFAKDFNGQEFIISPNDGHGAVFATDSSLKGYGVVTEDDWMAGYFNSVDIPQGIQSLDASHEHWDNIVVDDVSNINYLELVPIWLALRRYSYHWKDSHLLCLSDNTQVVAMLKNGHSTNKMCMVLLRRIFWICAKNNIYVTSKHIAGKLNVMPDVLSRLGDTYAVSDLAKYSICCSERIRAGCCGVRGSGGSVDVQHVVYT